MTVKVYTTLFGGNTPPPPPTIDSIPRRPRDKIAFVIRSIALGSAYENGMTMTTDFTFVHLYSIWFHTKYTSIFERN